MKDGMCEIDFCFGDYEYANDPSSYFESKFHYEVPYIIERDEGVIYLDNSFNTDVEGSIAAEFNKCLLDDVEIIKD